ncbi:hypothetical protein QBC38DRAFT_447264 [Podospora fimiseda]|uniref:ABM domain-containing protein n=1 Tax=Podospora fimiseda TaxID=252190 RepID=A0AAN7BHI1_9PEZI|nr:hypothetical protein QBC38DRAFT_447264 [Podospora fimiseda]
MTITEFAILNLATPSLTEETKAALTKIQAIQDDWHKKTFPNSPLSTSKRASAWLQQVEDPSKILTIAQWDTVQAHMDWVASDTNKTVMAELGHYFDLEKGFDLFHVDADFLNTDAPDSFLENPIISLGRLWIPRERKEAFSTRFNQVKPILAAFIKPKIVRVGWREDLPEGATEEESVMVGGWETAEDHLSFTKAPGFDEYSEIHQFQTRADGKHYKRFI